MNTTEINGSSWPLKYFFISAFPLVAVTVFLPLIAMSVFRFVVRKITSTKNLLKWIWILCTFILYIIADSMSYFSDSTSAYISGILYFIALITNLVVAITEAITEARLRLRRQGGLVQIYRHIRGHIGWSCFWIIAAASLFIGCWVQIWVELCPYVLFFFITFFR